MFAGKPLLVTGDEDLAEELSRLAAAAGCELRRAGDAAAAGEAWRDASLVLLDEPSSLACESAGLPRRAGMVLVGTEPPPAFWRAAFDRGVEHAIELPRDEQRLVELLAEAVEASAPRSGRVLAVIGGCGGAGASVLATATALTAARRGDRCLLLDCDPLGGGLDLALGAEREQGQRWSGLTVRSGRIAASALHEALPVRRVGPGELTLLSCDRDGRPEGMTPQSLRAVIGAGRRAGETVICDLPRSVDETVTTCLRQADLTVVVVPAEVRSCAAATRLVTEVAEFAGVVHLVVRGPAPGGLKVADVGRAVGCEVLTAMRPQAGLATALDRSGLGRVRTIERGPLARAGGEILAALGESHAEEITGPSAPGRLAATA